MWHPVEITLTNFLSHSSSRYNFRKNQTEAIVGRNVDDTPLDGTIGSNGSGKSAIVEGIMFALIGEGVRDAVLSDMIRHGESKACVEMSLYDDVNGRTVTIIREIFANRPTKASLLIDGVEKGVASVNDEVLRMLGLTKADIQMFFVVCKDSYTNFITSTDGDKKKVLNRLCDTSFITRAQDLINADVKGLDEQIQSLRREIATYEGRIQAHRHTLTTSSYDVWESARRRKIDEIQQAIDQAIVSRDNLIVEGKKLSADVKMLQSEVDVVESDEHLVGEIDATTKNRDNVFKRKTALAQKKSTIKAQHSVLNVLLGSTVECPQCNHKFAPSDLRSADQIASEIAALTTDLGNVERELDDVTVNLEQLTNSITALNAKRQQVNNRKLSLTSRLSKLSSDLAASRTRYSSLVDEIARRSNEIKSIAEQTFSLDVSALERIITENESQITQLTGQIDQITANRLQLQSLIPNVKLFASFLTSNSLFAIQNRTNWYLSKIQSQLSVSFSTSTTNKSGTVADKISVAVHRDGKASGYGRFSSGERTRINVCCILACQSLINASVPPDKGLNLLIMDEIVESVDAPGIDHLFAAMRNIEHTVIMITHATHNRSLHNNITVVTKSGGCSTIQQKT